MGGGGGGCSFLLAFCNFKGDPLRLERDTFDVLGYVFRFLICLLESRSVSFCCQNPHFSCMVARKSCFVLSFNRPRCMFPTLIWTILDALEGFSD